MTREEMETRIAECEESIRRAREECERWERANRMAQEALNKYCAEMAEIMARPWRELQRDIMRDTG